MIQAPIGATRKPKRLGRGSGSGLGKTSGRGHKGQNARSGGGVRPGFEGGQMPLYRRIARRGFSNYPFKVDAVPINLGRLSEMYVDGDVVDLQSLKDKGAVAQRVKIVKILGNGELTAKLTVRGLAISAGAKTKIEALGGTVEELEG